MLMRKFFSILFITLFLSSIYSFADDHALDCVVIDPGHGGKDPGAISKDKKTREKDLVLKIATLIGDKIKAGYSDSVKVYYTRTSDVFVPLQDRADFANGKKADLFISIHINAAYRTAPSGHSAHVLGASSNPEKDLVAGNLDVCKMENSVITLEDDYHTKYEGFNPDDDASYIFMTLMQGAFYEQSIYFAALVEDALTPGPISVRRGVEQNPFYVLWKTAMPAVLLELGFISNSSDLATLRSEQSREEIASRVYEAFREYKSNYDESMKYGYQ